MHNDLAKQIAKARIRQSKLTRLMHHYAAQLVAHDANLCELLTEAANQACSAGQLDGDVTAQVVVPKDD